MIRSFVKLHAMIYEADMIAAMQNNHSIRNSLSYAMVKIFGN